MPDVLKTVLSLSLSGSILALILFAGKPFLKNRVSKAFFYYIWLLVLLRLVMPISAPVNIMDAMFHTDQSSVTVLSEQTDGAAAQNTIGTVGTPAAATNTQTNPSQEQQNTESANTQRPFDLLRFIQINILWLWLAGAALSIGWFFIAYIVFSRRIRRSCTAPHSDDLAIFEHLCCGRHALLYCSSCVRTPMLIGVLRPVIILPQLAYISNGMEHELCHILRHELAHYSRKDVLYKWLVIVITSLHWFNPFMPLIRKEISRACELSCDEAVIMNMSADERQFYGNMLLSLSANKKLSAGILATTLCEDKKELKERLIGIKNYKKKTAWAVLLSLVLALLLTVCAAALGVVNGTTASIGLLYEVSEDVYPSGITTEKLLSEGTSISYTISAENENWTRHVDFEERNDPSYIERFPDLSALQAKYAGHTLFEMPIGASTSVTFYTELGLNEENISDFPPDPQYFRILIMNSRIKDVKVLDNQVAVIAEPADSGYQVITLKSDDLPDNTVFFLITPDGKAIDRLSDSTLVAAIPLSDIEPYEVPEVEITPAHSSDIASVIVSYVCENGTKILFYRAQNGDIFGAYQMGDGDVMQFTQGYWADDGYGNQEGYQDGYDIQPYENVFGHDGFYIVCSRGAAYTAYDYYYFQPDGTLKLMIQCCNDVIAQDLNGDGATELLWFYHGGAEAYYCYEINNTIYEADLDAILAGVLPDWTVSYDPDSVSNESIEITYIYWLERENDPTTYNGKIKFMEDSLMVYSKKDEKIGLSEQKNIRLPESGVLLASLPSDNIAVYGDKDNVSKYGDLYEGLYLSINGVIRYFEWETLVGSYDPELVLEDISGDGQKELVVFLTTASGTGVHISDIHVLDPKTFTETAVVDPLDIISENVNTSVLHENGSVSVAININGQKSAMVYNEADAGEWAENEVVFGNIIQYSVEDAKLIATVPAQVAFTVFSGDIKITYALAGTEYVMDSIEYILYE